MPETPLIGKGYWVVLGALTEGGAFFDRARVGAGGTLWHVPGPVRGRPALLEVQEPAGVRRIRDLLPHRGVCVRSQQAMSHVMGHAISLAVDMCTCVCPRARILRGRVGALRPESACAREWGSAQRCLRQHQTTRFKHFDSSTKHNNLYNNSIAIL